MNHTRFVDSQRDAHKHVIRSLVNLAVDFQEVPGLERFFVEFAWPETGHSQDLKVDFKGLVWRH